MFEDYDPEVTKSFGGGALVCQVYNSFFPDIIFVHFTILCMCINCNDQVEYYSVSNGSLLFTPAPGSGRCCFKTATLFRRNREIESERTSAVRN